MILKDKNILITGAAGRIGSSIAKLTFKNQANIIINDINSEKLDLLFDEFAEKDPSRVFKIREDITNSRGIENIINSSIKKFKSIDTAIHCAYPTSKKWGVNFENLDFDFLEKDLSMQLGSAIIFSQQIIKQFKLQKKGDLIHISSIQGISSPKFEHYEGTNMFSPIEYSAIKAGIISITKWLAKYYKNQGIRVNCVSPGGILDNQPKVFIDKYRESCNNIGMLNGNDIAESVLFLISSASKGINGQNIIVDDGWTL